MSWPMVELGSIANFINGFAFKPEHWEEGGKPIIRIQNLTDSSKSFNYSSMDIPEKYHVVKGDLLVSWSATLDVFEWHREDALLNQHIFKVEPNFAKVNKDYLRYALRDAISAMLKFTRGSTMKHVNRGDFLGTKIPLPPLETQKKIAAVLEKADQLRKDCQQMEQELNSLAQSVFIDMFGDPVTNPKGWKTTSLSAIASIQLGKMLSSKSKQNVNPKKYLRNANIQWREIGTADLLEMDFNEKEIKKFQLQRGDLLVCEGGEIGRCAIWNEQVQDCYYQKALHRVRVNPQLVTPEYLQEYFFWMAKLGGLVNSTNEVTFKHLTAEKMNKLKVPLAPIATQKDFSSIYTSIRRKLDINAEMMIETEASFNSVMQKAFKGELNL